MKILHKPWVVQLFAQSMIFLSTSLLCLGAVDPIRFTLISDRNVANLNEEFEVTIKASYLSLPTESIFVLEGSNAFRIKLITPTGFVQTGGNYRDYIGGELTPSNPTIEYKLKGKFVEPVSEGVFQLLRSHKNAESSSIFAEVGRLVFHLQDQGVNDDQENARTEMVAEAGSVMYSTLNAFYNGDVGNADLVYITDPYKEGFFKYNPTSQAGDDRGLVIVYNNRRYHRVYEGAVNVNWYGVIGDGVTDHTSTIQFLVQNSKFRKLYFPKNEGSYRINSIRIYPNRDIEFEKGVLVEGLGMLNPTDPMVYLIGVNNITLKGIDVVFKDHRENYTSGQQRHIFLIKGSKDITIEGISANDGGGDGFYIGTTSNVNYSENIKLVNVSANNNRRMGLTIISGKNINIIDSRFSNSNGEGPEAGINIEPNFNTDILEEIRLINPKTSNNKGSGILIAPVALQGPDKLIDIIVSNHIDDGSIVGAQVASVRSVLGGQVIFENPIWRNNKLSSFIARNWSYRGPMVQLLNPHAINPNVSGNTSINYGAAYLIYRAANDVGDDNIGNVHIIRPKIQDYNMPQKVVSAYCFRDISKSLNILNSSLIDPVKSMPLLNNNYLIAHNGEITVSDKDGALVMDMADYTRHINNWTYYSLFHNQSSNSLRVLNLAKMVPNFPEFTIEVRKSTGIRIIPHATDNIIPLSNTPGKYITSTQIGSRMVLKKMSENSWVIKEMTGNWVVQP